MTVNSPKLPPVHEAWLPREHSLHRPRHGKKQTAALLAALVFFAAPALMWVGGMRAEEIENRPLAEFPAPADGWGVFTGLPGWASDNLVFRPEAVRFVDWVSRTVFDEPADFDRAPSGPLPQDQSPPAGGEDRGPGTTEWPDQQYPGYLRVLEGRDGWLYFGYDVVAKCEPTVPLEETIRQLNRVRTAVEESGRRFVLVVPPDKSTMAPQFLPGGYPGKDCSTAAFEQFWRKATVLAEALDLREPLAAAGARKGEPVYYREDSHWTHEGALVMVRALAEELEPGVTEDWVIEARGEPTVGSADLPKLLGHSGENRGTSYALKPDGKRDRTQFKPYDLRKPVTTSEVPTNGMVVEPTVVLGDSFSLAAAPYLPGAFSDVTQLFYSTAKSDPGLTTRTVADHEVVVLQIVERNFAGGVPQVLVPSFVDALEAELAKRPVK